ncbi:MAG: DUF5615 family PIN-like protein [Candidatus Scalindua sp.]
MKFLADMGISPKTTDFLDKLGYNAIHLNDLGLNTLPDPDIMKKAKDEGYILLTHDLGFGELVAATKASLPSVIIFRLRNMHPDRVNHYLHKVISEYKKSLEHGAVISVTDGQIRVRQLPIKSDNI